MNKDIMKTLGFDEELARVAENKCPICNKPIGVFRDALSKREFEISGICQECQDKVFGEREG